MVLNPGSYDIGEELTVHLGTPVSNVTWSSSYPMSANDVQHQISKKMELLHQELDRLAYLKHAVLMSDWAAEERTNQR